MMISIRQATSSEELEATYRFRYRIYSEEMNGNQRHADDQKKTLVDPMDGQEGCYVLTAWEGDEIVGTVRTNFLRSSEIGAYYDLYSLRRLPLSVLRQAAITTRFMIHPLQRQRTLSILLAGAIFRLGLENGITTDFIDCNHFLVRYFTGLGYQVHQNEVEHPEYGLMTVMRLNLTDADHLKKLCSPFFHILREWQAKLDLGNQGREITPRLR